MRLGGLIQGRRCLIQKEELRLSKENPGEAESLLFAKRQALRPMLNRIELACERAEPYLFKHGSKPCCRKAAFIAVRISVPTRSRSQRIEQRIGQSAERQVGAVAVRREFAFRQA